MRAGGEAPVQKIELDHQHTLGRRELLTGLAAGTLALAGAAAWTTRLWAQPTFRDHPFSLGVASGDPLPDSVVLWTRLAPAPLAGGGMPMAAVEVGWELAGDPAFQNVLRRGTALARPEVGHSVHVEVGGLEPGRDHFYRFIAGGETSAVGRTRTAPAAGSPVPTLRLGVCGCQAYQDGWYTAYRHLADESLDLVFHYGDYIYEYWDVNRPVPPGRPLPDPADRHETFTLVDYRNRYALYKLDADLQAAHASAPFLASFDDHEVVDNWAGENDKGHTPPELFLLRRQAAFQAWYEHMPVRRAQLPRGPDMRAHRRVAWGALADIAILDTRQYRTDQPCDDTPGPRCPAEWDPDATITGSEQARWIEEGLARSGASWNVLAQQVMMAQLDRSPDPARPLIGPDKWDGYLASRGRLMDFIAERDVRGLIVLSGDIHSNWVADLKRDFDRPGGPVLGSEFVTTSISSEGDGSDTKPEMDAILARNPHVRFFNGQRGYLSCTVTPERWRADFRVVAKISTPDAAVATRASWVVERGEPGAKKA
jgi:alkaline phosphatase D